MPFPSAAAEVPVSSIPPHKDSTLPGSTCGKSSTILVLGSIISM
ncbi:hypothetical protein GCWU000341_01685 [Oribacterium sp. oral taxon 078 str. F0262]|nr:hypothetical protein GCWU000341_01685 [Oribacterium sp. oral taxon 078 str. F0262]